MEQYMVIGRKVRYGSSVSVVTGLVMWVLVTYVWKQGLPPADAAALPVIVSAVLGWVTAWYTKHAPQDLRHGLSVLIQDAEILNAQVQAIQRAGTLPGSVPVYQPVTTLFGTGLLQVDPHASVTGSNGSFPVSPPKVNEQQALGLDPYGIKAARNEEKK
jgi:hypothetical protein